MSTRMVRLKEQLLRRVRGTPGSRASFWHRSLATSIDVALFCPIWLLKEASLLGVLRIVFIIAVPCLLIFQGWLSIKTGQTIGKRIVGIKVISEGDNRVQGVDRGFRATILILMSRLFDPLGVPGTLEMIMAAGCLLALTGERRALHDYVYNTLVVHEAPAYAPVTAHHFVRDLQAVPGRTPTSARINAAFVERVTDPAVRSLASVSMVSLASCYIMLAYHSVLSVLARSGAATHMLAVLAIVLAPFVLHAINGEILWRRSSSVPAAPSRPSGSLLEAHVAAALAAARITVPVSVRLSRDSHAPYTFQYFDRAVIVVSETWPDDLAHQNYAPSETLRAALLHEVGHIYSKDSKILGFCDIFIVLSFAIVALTVILAPLAGASPVSYMGAFGLLIVNFAAHGYITRRREAFADAFAAGLQGTVEFLMRALDDAHTEPNSHGLVAPLVIRFSNERRGRRAEPRASWRTYGVKLMMMFAYHFERTRRIDMLRRTSSMLASFTNPDAFIFGVVFASLSLSVEVILGSTFVSFPAIVINGLLLGGVIFSLLRATSSVVYENNLIARPTRPLVMILSIVAGMAIGEIFVGAVLLLPAAGVFMLGAADLLRGAARPDLTEPVLSALNSAVIDALLIGYAVILQTRICQRAIEYPFDSFRRISAAAAIANTVRVMSVGFAICLAFVAREPLAAVFVYLVTSLVPRIYLAWTIHGEERARRLNQDVQHARAAAPVGQGVHEHRYHHAEAMCT